MEAGARGNRRGLPRIRKGSISGVFSRIFRGIFEMIFQGLPPFLCFRSGTNDLGGKASRGKRGGFTRCSGNEPHLFVVGRVAKSRTEFASESTFPISLDVLSLW